MSSIAKVKREMEAARLSGVDRPESARERKQRTNATLKHWASCGHTYIEVTAAMQAAARPRFLRGMYANATFSVQIYDKFDHLGITWLLVRRHDEGTAFAWYDLQHAKNSICGPERLAVEVFPPESELVDDANIRHLWVYPAGHKLGFGL